GGGRHLRERVRRGGGPVSPRGARAMAGASRRRVRALLDRRAHARRMAHRHGVLAVEFLHQHPGRDRGVRRGGVSAAAYRAGPEGKVDRLRGRAPPHRRLGLAPPGPDLGRNAIRLGIAPDPRALRARARGDPALHVRGGARGGAHLALSLFSNRIFTVSMVALFLVGIGMFGSIVFIPLYAQLVLGVNATHSGTILTPLTLAFVTASVISGQLTSRTGRYKSVAVVGLGLATVALFAMSRMSATTSPLSLVLRMIATGLGIGATLPVFTLAVQNAFEHELLGVATASSQLFRSIGATVGTAVLGSVLNARLARELGSFGSDPSLRLVGDVVPSVHLERADANSLQAILTQPGRGLIEARLAQLPPGLRTQAEHAFLSYLGRAREAFAASITETFLIAAVLMGAAFVVSCFLKEIPLRKTHAERPGESAGMELGVERGVFPAGDEPGVL